MCKSNITVKKFLKLFIEVELYKMIYIIFLMCRYEPFSVKQLLKTIFPIFSIGNGFTNSYLAFFLFIPFLNILIHGMNKKQHLRLIGICIVIYTILPTIFMSDVKIGYVGWFMVIYIIGAYIRLYPNEYFSSRRFCGIGIIVSLLISWLSVIACIFMHQKFGTSDFYFFVVDSNKLLAVVTAVFAFMFFKNLNIGYSRIINSIAASAFGVLLIHANSDAMRRWLWKDVLNNVGFYHSKFLILHAIGSVVGIYIICTIIDMIRIKFVEKPFFKWYDEYSLRRHDR